MDTKTQQFIEKAKAVHGDKYDYTDTVYVKTYEKVTIKCPQHGHFNQLAKMHLRGQGCKQCSHLDRRTSVLDIIQEAKTVHGNKYDYSHVTEYISDHQKMTVICPMHGQFQVTRNAHISNKNGCPDCARDLQKTRSSAQRLGKDKFVGKAKAKHGDKYNYDKVEYVGAHKKVIITCPKHGDFKITPANHWHAGVGCTACMHSNPTKGEAVIAKWLETNCFEFEAQKRFPDLRGTKGRRLPLRFDFFVPSLNLLIEYDGEHHTQPIRFSSDDDPVERLKYVKECDLLKSEYALRHGYNLLRISYKDDIISRLAEL